MTKFIYNNPKNINIGYIVFKLNYTYYFYIFFKDKTNSDSKFQLNNRLNKNLQKLIMIYLQNLFHI